MNAYPNARDCEHGSRRGSCTLCDNTVLKEECRLLSEQNKLQGEAFKALKIRSELLETLLFNAMHELSDLRMLSETVIAEMVDEKEVEKALSNLVDKY